MRAAAFLILMAFWIPTMALAIALLAPAVSEWIRP